MTKMKISLFVVTVAATALALAACGGGGMKPGTTPDPATTPAYVGTWHVTKPAPTAPAATLELTKDAFTVTVGDGMAPLSATVQTYATVTKATVTGTLAVVEGDMYTLTVADDGVVLMFVPGVDAAQQSLLTAGITGALQAADDAPVTVTISADGSTMTLSGAFVAALLSLPADTSLTACKGDPCAAT